MTWKEPQMTASHRGIAFHIIASNWCSKRALLIFKARVIPVLRLGEYAQLRALWTYDSTKREIMGICLANVISDPVIRTQTFWPKQLSNILSEESKQLLDRRVIILDKHNLCHTNNKLIKNDQKIGRSDFGQKWSITGHLIGWGQKRFVLRG